jgi:hypothetical protein
MVFIVVSNGTPDLGKHFVVRGLLKVQIVDFPEKLFL